MRGGVEFRQNKQESPGGGPARSHGRIVGGEEVPGTIRVSSARGIVLVLG